MNHMDCKIIAFEVLKQPRVLDYEPYWIKKNSLHKNENFHHSLVYLVKYIYAKFQKQVRELPYSKTPCNTR